MRFFLFYVRILRLCQVGEQAGGIRNKKEVGAGCYQPHKVDFVKKNIEIFKMIPQIYSFLSNKANILS